MFSALAMTFNIIVFYKNYQEPYRWKSYVDTVQNISNDAAGEKFIIENGSESFSQMGFVYSKNGYWNEVTNDANIVYHLESSVNNTNIINLPIISSNNIYIVYKKEIN